MDFRQLRTFVNVAELGSISLAAERLHIAQPALTRQIQALESDIQVRLFERNGRGVSLTSQGKTLLIRATMILQEVEHARAEMVSEEVVLTGQVSFGVPASLTDLLAGPLVQKFAELYPQVNLRIQSAYSGHLLEWLQHGAVDLGVVYEVSKSPMLKLRPLLVERLYLAEHSEAASRSDVPFAEVAARHLVLPSRQHGIRLLVEEAAAQIGVEILPLVEVDSLPLQVDLVRRGLGATILPLSSIHSEVRQGLLSARLIVEPTITARLALASSVDHPMTPAAQRFADMVMGEVAEAVSAGRWEGLPSAEEYHGTFD
jgi:DNA-binding transcriptional LysR family regulator